MGETLSMHYQKENKKHQLNQEYQSIQPYTRQTHVAKTFVEGYFHTHLVICGDAGKMSDKVKEHDVMLYAA